MKHLILPIFGAALLFASCKETGPAIDFGPKAADTSFMAVTETPDQRMVVMEEFTGVTCVQCPKGHNLLQTIEAANPGRVAAVGMQIYNFIQCNPCNDASAVTRHDNRTQDGTDISDVIYGSVSAMPAAGIDRVMVSTTRLLDYPMWSGIVASRLTVTPDANIAITSNYNAATRQAAITVHVAYTSAVAKAQKLTVALTENNIIDAQEGVGATGFEQNYVHQHVLRDILTNSTGNTILNDKPTKQPGQVYERTFIYDVNPDWNPDNCEIVAYVTNDAGPDQEVVQSAEKHLK